MYRVHNTVTLSEHMDVVMHNAVVYSKSHVAVVSTQYSDLK